MRPALVAAALLQGALGQLSLALYCRAPGQISSSPRKPREITVGRLETCSGTGRTIGCQFHGPPLVGQDCAMTSKDITESWSQKTGAGAALTFDCNGTEHVAAFGGIDPPSNSYGAARGGVVVDSLCADKKLETGLRVDALSQSPIVKGGCILKNVVCSVTM